MNKSLLDLLAKTSGIIHTAQGVLSKKIDPGEYHNLLHMKTIKFNIAVDNKKRKIQWRCRTDNKDTRLGRRRIPSTPNCDSKQC